MNSPRSGFRRAAAASWALAGIGVADVAGASSLAYADSVKPAAAVPVEVEIPAAPTPDGTDHDIRSPRSTDVGQQRGIAHIALIASRGPAWFRSVGDAAEAGTMLVTLSDAHAQPGVAEVPTGSQLADILTTTGHTDLRRVRAVLLGGHHGSWIPARAPGARLSRDGLAPLGATPGAGVVHVLGRDECGLERIAEVAS